MHRTLFFYLLFVKIYQVVANSYSVNIGTEKHVNLIDKRFLSFTIDPKYLFSNNGKYKSKECICMASSLTPAYIRIAGPSTALMSYHNASIAIEEPQPQPQPQPQGRRTQFQSLFSDNLARIDQALRRDDPRRDGREEGRFKRNPARLEVSHGEWRRFVRWAKTAGFDLVFAVNNHDKMAAGIWDPNMALNILTVAEKADVGDIYWQLGYECSNQSIEEYLNDLETLRVIIETFPAGQRGEWRLAGGDVTGCLQAGSSDFKDYVTLSSDLMDAILLNGNSSTSELARLSERDRLKLLRLLSESTTPLWLTEQPWSDVAETSRAADWLTSLGHAARNGFSVHYRELDEEEMYQPTLSFYMALLYKNLVGARVLHVDMQPDQAIMFAHCTTLRHKEVPGAVTLYGVNLDAEPARFSVKLGRRAEGGDVLQFILGRDRGGNIIVNGKPMYHEGDLKPVVKRVRPYKTLLLNLPAQSFGFWVLANTKVDACFDEKLNETENIDDAVPLSQEQGDFKTKRSVGINHFEEYTEDDSLVDFSDGHNVSEEDTSEALKDGIENIHKDLSTVNLLGDKLTDELRVKRQTDDAKPINRIRQLIRKNIKSRNVKTEEEKSPKGLLSMLKKTRSNITKHLKTRKINLEKPVYNKNNLIKRQSDGRTKKSLHKRRSEKNDNHEIKNFRYQTKPLKKNDNVNVINSLATKTNKVNVRKTTNQEKDDVTKLIHTDKTLTDIEKEMVEKKERTRRSVKDQVEFSAENEIDNENESEVIDDVKLWKLLQRIHKQIKEISDENDEYVDDMETKAVSEGSPQSRTHKHDTRAKDINLDYNDSENKSDTTFLKSTLFSLLRVISDLNNNLNKFWNGIRLVD